jgi:enoyl-CoA hydratase
MDYKYLLLAKEGPIGIVTINRPKSLNALNAELFGELYNLFQEIEADPVIRVVILTGSGDKAFIAGADAMEMQGKTPMNRDFMPLARKASDQIYNLSKPTIAAVNGYALGGGNELAMCCDLRIASENARFGQLEVNLAILPGGGGISRLIRLVGMTKAKEMVYTGEMIDAKTALEIGLINKVVPPDKLMEESKALAMKIASKSSVTLSLIKRSFNSGVDMSLSSGLDMDEQNFRLCFASEDQKEGLKAFAEKRKPEFKNR